MLSAAERARQIAPAKSDRNLSDAVWLPWRFPGGDGIGDRVLHSGHFAGAAVGCTGLYPHFTHGTSASSRSKLPWGRSHRGILTDWAVRSRPLQVGGEEAAFGVEGFGGGSGR